MVEITQYALKGQKLLAQGSALGRYGRKVVALQGALPIAIIPRALPWAVSFCPFRACCWGASALYLSLRPVTVGSGRAVGELLDLLGVPTVQVETYCSIQVITHYCLGNRVVAFDPEKTEYTQTKKTFAFLFF